MCLGSAMQHSRLQYLFVGFLTGLSQPPQAHLRIAEDTTYTPCNAPRYPAALPVHHSPAYDALQQMTLFCSKTTFPRSCGQLVQAGDKPRWGDLEDVSGSPAGARETTHSSPRSLGGSFTTFMDEPI